LQIALTRQTPPFTCGIRNATTSKFAPLKQRAPIDFKHLCRVFSAKIKLVFNFLM
jgi:hypothetical protein